MEHRKIKPSMLFIYAIAVSIMAFVFNLPSSLLIPSLLNFILGICYGRKTLPMKLIFVILMINAWGALINGIYFHNTGPMLFKIGGLSVRYNALTSFLLVNLRFFLIIGSTLFMLGMSGGSRELIRSLERDLGMPPWIAFSISHAFRLFPLISRDYRELQIARKERKAGTNILNPLILKEVLISILNVSYERAQWSGISAELRGVKLRKRIKKEKLSIYDIFILSLIAVEWAIAIIFVKFL